MSSRQNNWLDMGRVRRLLQPADLDEIERDVDKDLLYRGGDGKDSSSMEDGEDNNPKTEIGDTKWKKEIDERVRGNSKTSRENKKLLAVVDERTSIMMKLMLATLITFIVSVAAGVLIVGIELLVM